MITAKTLAGLLAPLLIHGLVHAVEFSPAPVVFTSLTTPVTVSITDNGAPVPQSAIGAVRFLIEGKDYSRMMQVARIPGGLRLTPTATLEIGTYELEVVVNGKTVICPARATLVDEPDSMENRVRAQGRSEAEIRRELGQFATGHARIALTLPASYQVGHQMRIAMDAPASSSYEWLVNGESVEKGQGPHEFVYTFRAAGAYEFLYRETGAGGTAEARAQTQARDADAVPVSVRRGYPVDLTGPEGYAAFTWMVDGEFAGEARTFTYRAGGPGEHRIECIATGNDAIPNEGFRKVVYAVTVR